MCVGGYTYVHVCMLRVCMSSVCVCACVCVCVCVCTPLLLGVHVFTAPISVQPIYHPVTDGTAVPLG